MTFKIGAFTLEAPKGCVRFRQEDGVVQFFSTYVWSRANGYLNDPLQEMLAIGAAEWRLAVETCSASSEEEYRHALKQWEAWQWAYAFAKRSGWENV